MVRVRGIAGLVRWRVAKAVEAAAATAAISAAMFSGAGVEWETAMGVEVENLDK